MPARVQLRPVEEGDLPIFYEHQLDDEANRVASFRPRDRDAFMAHWTRILADPTTLARTIEADGTVVGTIGSWNENDIRLVGYWIGREHWGRGFATAGLARFLETDLTRPLYALVVASNVGSIRVLERSGFARSNEPFATDLEAEELVYRFDGPATLRTTRRRAGGGTRPPTGPRRRRP